MVRLARRPHGVPVADDFHIVSEDLRDLADGELLVGVEHVSLNPAMRNWIRAGEASSLPGLAVGELMRAEAVGRVLVSGDERYAPGDPVFGMFGVQELAIVAPKRVAPIDESLGPLSAHLGVLGLQGLSAYFGIHDIARVAPGETVVVSGAAGAVGSIAGQLATRRGGRTIGIVGGPQKAARIVDELGFAAAIDHRAGDVGGQLEALAPDGIDVVFDNVGGEVLDATLNQLAVGARVVLCGATSQYNADGPMRGPTNYFQLVHRRARMEGFLVMDHADRYGEGRIALGRMLAAGELRGPAQVLGTGIDEFPAALAALFGGDNFGKALLQVVP